ncbi:MAG: hypothetical protein K1X89_07030 [Myxococcaceae bacterium]|nr:hypothetical protein [Myxococcaceae bacterium]
MKPLAALDAEAFVASGLVLSRVPQSQPALEALLAALEERPALPLPLLALLLPGLWAGGSLGGRPQAALAPSLADALRAFEDHLVARLLAEARWPRLLDAAAGLPPGARAQAAGLLCEQLARTLELPDADGVSRAAVKRLLARPEAEVLEEGQAVLSSRPEVWTRWEAPLLEAAQRAKRTPALLSDGEVFLVEHVQALTTLAARVALAQLALAAQAVEALLPARLKSQTREDGDAAAALDDDAAYPVGGFSSVSNQGTPENLVTSELVYMDDAARPDLFDVRFVEGELLYYARDESVAVRRRRHLVVAVDGGLGALRGALGRFQPAVWLLGGVVALVRRLLGWLETEALTVELVFLGEADALAAERAAVELVLREYRERGQVEVRVAPGWSALEGERRGRSLRHLLAVGQAGASVESAPAALSYAPERFEGRAGSQRVGGSTASPEAALAAAVKHLLQNILGAKPPAPRASAPAAPPGA